MVFTFENIEYICAVLDRECILPRPKQTQGEGMVYIVYYSYFHQRA